MTHLSPGVVSFSSPGVVTHLSPGVVSLPSFELIPPSSRAKENVPVRVMNLRRLESIDDLDEAGALQLLQIPLRLAFSDANLPAERIYCRVTIAIRAGTLPREAPVCELCTWREIGVGNNRPRNPDASEKALRVEWLAHNQANGIGHGSSDGRGRAR